LQHVATRWPGIPRHYSQQREEKEKEDGTP